jgi:hypothetical protein
VSPVGHRPGGQGWSDPRFFTEIGSGVLPIGDILQAVAGLPRCEYVLLEHDHTRLDDLESVISWCCAGR